MKISKLIFTALLISLFFVFSCKKETTVKDMPVKELKTFTGYLVDVTCGGQEAAMDKTNTITSPMDHTVHCLSVCAASGFGIMTKEEGKETYKFIKFDEKGTKLGLDVLRNTTKEKNVSIEVKGTYENDIISVEALTEI